MDSMVVRTIHLAASIFVSAIYTCASTLVQVNLLM